MSVKCGWCKEKDVDVAHVRRCSDTHYQEKAQMEEDHAQQQAELAAEQRNERYWEERGASEPEDPREIAAQQRDEELRYKAAMAQREQEQEQQAYLFKMQRDEAMAAGAVMDRLQGQPSGFNPDPPSDKQVQYALDLLDKKVWPQELDEADIRNMARRQVTKLIDGLKDAQYRQRAKELWVPEVGMYWTNNKDIVRVYHGQKSGQNLVKVIRENGEYEPGVTRYKYHYLGSAKSLVRGKTELGRVELFTMDKEEAMKWGRLTRSCVVCGRRLDVPESVDRGIGPVCYGRGWSGEE